MKKIANTWQYKVGIFFSLATPTISFNIKDPHTIGSFTYTQKCQYWHFCLYCMKKKSSEKKLPLVGIEPGQPMPIDMMPIN